MEERFSDSRPRIRYLIGGNGPPLVLCHGFLGSAENFSSWFPRLKEVRTLIIPDLPGCGKSEPLNGVHSCAAIADAVQPVIDELKLEKFDLGGLCLGGGVAFELLKRNPDRVGRIALHTPRLSPHFIRDRFHMQASLLTSPILFNVITWLGHRRRVSDLYKRFVVEGSDVDAREAEINFQNQMAALPRAAKEWLRDGLLRRDLPLLASHEDEALVIAAREDRILDVPALSQVMNAIPKIHLVILGGGHGWSTLLVQRQQEILAAFFAGQPIPRFNDNDTVAA